MKRNENLVPEFDEIIFENRNRKYGAFDLRRKYKSVTSFSIITGVIISTSVVLAVAFTSPTDVNARDKAELYILIEPENLIEPEKIVEPELKKPEIPEAVPRYVAPKVVDEDIQVTEMMTAGEATETIHNGEATETVDTIKYETDVIDAVVEDEPVIIVEEEPVFPGGPQELLRYVARNVNYPQDALENNIQGRVFVKFAVWSDGSIRRIEVTKSIFPSLDQEAMRVISTLPKWTPGRQNGKAVSVWFSMPVTFQIKNN